MIEFNRALALGYCDGPTNGFALSNKGDWKYFKMIAMDNDADQRLFAIRSAASTAVAALEEHLTRSEKRRTPIWAPTWQFSTTQDRDTAEQLAVAAENSTSGHWALALGSSILSIREYVVISSEMEGTVQIATERAGFDLLAEWLPIWRACQKEAKKR